MFQWRLGRLLRASISAKKRKAAREGSPSRVDRGPAKDRLDWRRLADAIDLTRGEHPGSGNRRPRIMTLRHWITSFRLLLGWPHIESRARKGNRFPYFDPK